MPPVAPKLYAIRAATDLFLPEIVMSSPATPAPLNWYTKERAKLAVARRSSQSTESERSIRILLADERPIFRDGLRALLKATPGFKVVGEAVDKDSLVRLAQEQKPDIVLLDSSLAQNEEMTILNGLAAIEHPVRTLLFTQDAQKSEILRMLQLGARGVIMKGSTTQMLLDGIRKVVDGQYWIGEESVVSLVEAMRDLAPATTSRAARPKFGLTHRELEIISTVVSGYSNSDIASNFALSEHTVKHHLSRVFDKLGVSNRLELALFAVNHQLTNDLP
jgi:two-component system, NarL family, nitrate/nitrite response regulator NarL